MFKQNMKIGVFLFFLSLSIPAWAVDNPFLNALINDPWHYTGFVYDSKHNVAGWYKGELKFYSNNRVDIRTIDSSGNFDPTSVMQLKYDIDNNGKISITSTNLKDAYPYFGGQMNKSQDKISAVLTIDNKQPNELLQNPNPGIILLTRKSTVPFNSLDVVGQWGGKLFANNGKDGIGWISFDLSVNAQGQVKGTETKYNGDKGSFQGQSTIDENGKVTMTIINDQDKNATPVQVKGQMSKERDSLSFGFAPAQKEQVGTGIGVMIKK